MLHPGSAGSTSSRVSVVLTLRSDFLGAVRKIKEKNSRIRKIVEDLEMQYKVVDPALGVVERPEDLLFVEDHEVSARLQMLRAGSGILR